MHCIGSTADTDDCLLLIALGMVAAAAEQGGSAAEALQKPLHILHGILRDVASRLALNEAVVWVRSAAKAPPWAKLLRAEKSVLFSMGVRSVSSHVQTTHRSIERPALQKGSFLACQPCGALPSEGQQRVDCRWK